MEFTNLIDIIPTIRTELDIDKDENPKIFYTTDSSKRMILSLTNKSINKPFSSITDKSELDLTDNK